jgi:hypothetical protein
MQSRIARLVLVGVVVFGLSAAASAGLNLTRDYPLVTGNTTAGPALAIGERGVEYRAADEELEANGIMTNYKLTEAAASQNFVGNPFTNTVEVDLIVDSAGVASSGTLAVVADRGSGLETLFSSSTLVQFDVRAADVFEAVFVSDAGSALVADGSLIGVILDVSPELGSGVPDFSGDFGPTGRLKADVFAINTPIPEAGTLGLSFIGLVATALRRRRRS